MEAWIKECERILCSSVNQQGGFDAYLVTLAPKDCGGQCTAIWPAGALAYRCRTCQLTASSAVCVSCFKAGGHEDHDWIQYRSPSGGCCDCGDLSAWRIEGCCPAHQPNRRVVLLEQLLQPHSRMLLEAVLEAALARLTECIGLCSGMRCSADRRREVVALCSWLQRFASLAPVRRSMSRMLRRPLEHEPAAGLDEETAEWQMQRRLEMLRETRNVVRQQKLIWQQQDQRLQELQGRIQGHLERLRQVRIQEEQRLERLRELQQALSTMVAGEQTAGGTPGGEATLETSSLAASGVQAAAADAAGSAPPSTEDFDATGSAFAFAHASSAGASGSTPTSVAIGAALPLPSASSMACASDIAAASKALAAAATLMDPSNVQPDTHASTSASVQALVEVPMQKLAANVYLMQARHVIARLPKPTLQACGTASGSHDDQDCLLRRWVHGLRWVHPEPLHHLTSLLLLLLYDMEFKYDTAVYVMECYAPMVSVIGGLSPSHQVAAADGVEWFAGSGSGRHPLCGMFDRIMVQLFNSEEVTSRLALERDVMGTHLSVLAYITGIFADELGKAAAPAATASEEGNSVLEQRMNAILDALRRLASDFGTLVHHASAARHLLCNVSLWREVFLGRFVRPLQAILPHRRKVSGDVEERAAFRVPLACSAEYAVTACVCELLITIAGLRPAATGAAHSSGGGSAGGNNNRGGSGGGCDEERRRRVELLFSAARQAFEACEEWCSERVQRSGAIALAAPEAAAGGGTGKGAHSRRLSAAADLYDGLLSAELEVSPHLPLHRTAAAFVQALLHLEQQGGPTGQLARSRIEELLSLQASLDEGSAWRPVSRFLLLNQAFVSQIIARRWLRNGDDVSQVELFVLNGRELSELDVLMTQCWMAAEDPNVVLYDILSAMGAKPLLVAAGVTAPGASAAGNAPATASPAELQDPASAAACSEALRWLVTLLRERSVAGLDPRDRLRSHLVQWLALRDLTYNQLHELLPQDLQQQQLHMEEILAEVATYRAASLSQARHYSLKGEAWELFCPAFIHYTPSMRSRAWEAAMAAARAPGGRAAGSTYQPHWQLRRPRHPLPASLEPMLRVLEMNGLWRLVTWVLQTYLSGAPRLPEDTLLGTLNLLALQLQRMEDLLGLLSPPVTCRGEGVVPPPSQLAGLKSELADVQQTSTSSPDKDPFRLRASILIAAQALTGGLQPVHARGHRHHHHHHHHHHDSNDNNNHRDAQPHESQGHIINFQPSSNHPQDVPMISSGTGIVTLLACLLQSQTPGLGPTVSPAAATGSSMPASVHLSSETVDCLNWLLMTARRLVQAAEASDVHAAAPRAEVSAAAISARPRQERDRVTLDITTDTGTGGGPATETAVTAEAEAARRKELARQRQADMMAKLKAQQEAFLRRSAGQGADARDSSDKEDKDSDDEDAAESEEEQGRGRESGQRLVSAAGVVARRNFSGNAERLEGGAGGSIGDSSSSSSSSEDRRGVGVVEAGWSSSGPSDSSLGEGERESDVIAQQRENNAPSDDVSGDGGHRHRRRSRNSRRSPAAVAGAVAQKPSAARQRLLLGRWLPVDIAEPECAVCREGTAGGRHGPLAFIAHTAVCFCTSAPLRPVRAWDDDPTMQAAETVAASSAAAAPETAAAPPDNMEDWGIFSDRQTEANDPSKARHGAAAREAWLRVWRHQGPAVGEADLGGGLHVHCCGHMIHTQCFARFVAGQLRQYFRGGHFPGSHLVMPEMSEFLCPVCRRLANGIVPAAPFQWRPPTAAVAAAAARTSVAPRPLRSRTGPGPMATALGADTVTGRVECISDRACESRGMSGANDRSGDAIMVVGQDQQTLGSQVLLEVGSAMEVSSAATTPSPALPPLGHAGGLGALQGLMESLGLCVESQGGLALKLGPGPGPARRKGAASRRGELGRSPGSGNRGGASENMFGAYAEVFHMATHQMTREGINQMAQLERALEARARLLQLRSQPGSAMTASPTSAAQVTPNGSWPAATAQQQQQQQQGQRVQEDLTSMEVSISPHRGDTDSAAADVTSGAVADARAGAATEAAAVPVSANVNATRSPWLLRWQHAMPAPLRLPPLPEPKLACCCRRVPDVASIWKGLSSRTRLWSAVAHNLAHFEAVRRPLALASGVLGGPVSAAADPAVARKRNEEEASGSSGTGGSVTGLPAVEAAHWRAIVALVAMAMCGGSRPAGVSGDAAVSAGPVAPPSVESGAGVPVRTMDALPETLLMSRDPQDLQLASQPLALQHYQQQPNRQLQPLLATFHTQLGWLLCELPTLGVTETTRGQASPAIVPERAITKQQLLPSSSLLQTPFGGTVLSGPEIAPREDSLAQPPPPATSLDWTCGFLRPCLPEVVIPRLEATLIEGDTPSIRSRSDLLPHTAAYLPALALRRLMSLDELTADPLLLTLELLSVGLSGLAGASLPDPAPEPPLAVPATGSAGTDLASWLPRSPQELLRTVLRIVWPIQVLQGALWRTARATRDVDPPVPVGQPHESAAATSPSRLGQASPPPPPPPSEPDLPGEDPSCVHLLRLYFRALKELPCDQVEEQVAYGSACVGSNDPCGPRLALGGLSAALLPFLVRAYALDCALSRQFPDPVLMAAYSSLPLSQPRHHQRPNQPTGQQPSAGGTGSTVAGSAVNEALAADAAASPSRVLGTSSAWASGTMIDETAVTASQAAAATTGRVAAGTEAGPTEEELRGAACAAELADHLVAALGLSDIPNALRDPLLLSRRRAAEAVATVAATAMAAKCTVEGLEAARSSSADRGSGRTIPAAQSHLSPGGPPMSSSLEEALLACILTRWCGPRAIPLVTGTAAMYQDSPPGGVAAEPVKDLRGVPAAPSTSSKAGAAGTAALQRRPRLTWYRGLPSPPSLIPLPYLFQSLFLHFAETRCPDCGADAENPALCLLTGRFVCNLWRGCVDRRGRTGAFGGGLLHAREHCGGSCLLLSLRSTRVVAVRGNRLAMCQSPYLDAHGDEDPDLRRGRPLYLDVECYRQLARLWGSAALEFDTQLLHSSRADLVGL